MSHKSDFGPASIGFFGGVIILAAFVFTISRWTTAKFESHKAEAGQAAH
jgi:hypothetical protein